MEKIHLRGFMKNVTTRHLKFDQSGYIVGYEVTSKLVFDPIKANQDAFFAANAPYIPMKDDCFTRGLKCVLNPFTLMGLVLVYVPALATTGYKMSSTMQNWNSCEQGTETVTDCGSKEGAIADTILWSLAFSGLVCIPICFCAIWCIGSKIEKEAKQKASSEKTTLLPDQKV